MTRFLPVLISLFVIRYSLFVTPSFAQEPTPSAAPALQINPQAANPWEEFLKNLIPAQSEFLGQYDRSRLPLEVGEDVKNAAGNISGDNSKSSIKPQDNSSENNDNSKVIDSAYKHKIAGAVDIPAEVSKTSTDIFDVFGGIFDFFKNLDKIFSKGEEGAEQFGKSAFPQPVNETLLGPKTQKQSVALPLRECAELPADLCTDGKPNNLSFPKSEL